MSLPEARSHLPVSVSRTGRLTAAAATGALLIYQVFAAFSRVLVNDDYQTLYTAWLKAQGKVPGRDFFLASYYLLPDLLSVFFRLDLGTWAPLYAGRLLLVGMMVIVAILLHRLGARLFSPTAGWLAPVFGLSSAAMIYRGLDLRPDLITTVSWLAILTLLARPSLSDRKTAAVGMLLGLSVLNRFKAALIAPFLLLEYVARRPQRSPWRGVFFTSLGALAVFAVYAVWIALTDDLRTFFEINRRLLGGMGQFEALGTGARARTLHATLVFDSAYWALAGVGTVLRARHRTAYEPHDNRLCATLFALAVSTVVLNPVYYEYNLVTLQALLAPFAAYGVAQIIEVARPRRAAAALLVALPILLQSPALVRSLTPSNRHQKALQTFLEKYTPADAPVFAMEGIGLYRPSVFHWRMPWIYVDRYRKGEWRFADEFRRNPPEIVVASYRVPGWMVWSDRQFLASHYQWLTPQLMVPGFATDGSDGDQDAELLAGGDYEGLRQGAGRCLLNGRPFTTGDRLTLPAGTHRVTAFQRTRCALRRHYAAEARALLANPEGFPYLAYVTLGSVPDTVPTPRDRSLWGPPPAPDPLRASGGTTFRTDEVLPLLEPPR